MSKGQSLIIATIALMVLYASMNGSENGYTKAEGAGAAAAAKPMAAPAPTPTKNRFPTGSSTDTVQQPAGIKGTVKFKTTGAIPQNLSCEDIEVRINKGPETMATVQASGDFSKRRCSFNFSGLPANVALALLVPKPKWVPNKCSQLQFDNQALALPPLKPGVTRPVIITIKTLKCYVI